MYFVPKADPTSVMADLLNWDWNHEKDFMENIKELKRKAETASFANPERQLQGDIKNLLHARLPPKFRNRYNSLRDADPNTPLDRIIHELDEHERLMAQRKAPAFGSHRTSKGLFPAKFHKVDSNVGYLAEDTDDNNEEGDRNYLADDDEQALLVQDNRTKSIKLSCFFCKEVGHIKRECPKLDAIMKAKRAEKGQSNKFNSLQKFQKNSRERGSRPLTSKEMLERTRGKENYPTQRVRFSTNSDEEDTDRAMIAEEGAETDSDEAPSSNEQESDDEEAYAVDLSRKSISSREADDPYLWVLDSGASRHMTRSEKNLQKLSPLRSPIRVRLADGNEVECHQVGTLKGTIGGGDLSLSNVLLVPKLDRNLVSTRCLQAQGIYTIFGKTTMLMTKKGKVVAHAKRGRKVDLLQQDIRNHQFYHHWLVQT